MIRLAWEGMRSMELIWRSDSCTCAKLKPSCVAEPESYEERVARRKEEIESLQDALKILSGDDIA